MPAQTGQSPTGNAHPNRPSDPARASQTRTDPAPKADRRKYLATTYNYTEEQIDVIRAQICLSASDAEMEFFLATCKRVSLDPFSKQIYFIKRKQKVEDEYGNENYVEVGRPEVSIDGLRSSAESTGDYGGQDPYQWCGDDGQWTDVWLDDLPPHAARATVYRKSHPRPMISVAHLKEFRPVFKGRAGVENYPQMWRKMPANQLAKCAEAGAFRRAFPRDLSGLYISEEMEQSPIVGSAFDVPQQSEQPPAIEQRALPIPSADDMLKQIAEARTRADIAGVGRVLQDLRKRSSDEAVKAVLEKVEPVMSKAYSTLPKA